MRSLLLGLFLLTQCAFAQQAEELTQKALREASQVVRERQQAAAAPPQPGLAPHITSADYKVGQTWIVGVKRLSSTMARKEAPAGNELVWVSPNYYQFKVTQSEGNRVTIEVHETDSEGRPVPSHRLDHVELTLDLKSHPQLISKKYFYPELSAPVVVESSASVFPPGGFDFYPLDLPDFEKNKLISGYDIFARKIEYEWKNAEPWPRRFETKNIKTWLEDAS